MADIIFTSSSDNNPEKRTVGKKRSLGDILLEKNSSRVATDAIGLNTRGHNFDRVDAQRMAERGIKVDPNNPEHATEHLARSQSIGELMGKALVQAGSQVVLGGLEGAGYLFDIQQHIDLISGEEVEFGNVFSNTMRDLQDKVSSEVAPITMTQEGQSGWMPTDATWWASHVPSIASSLSLLIPAMGASKALAAGAKGAARATGLTKRLNRLKNVDVPMGGSGVTNVGEMIEPLAKRLDAVYNTTSTAAFSRGMENMMEGMEVYDEVKTTLMQQGVSAQEAEARASHAAANSYKANWVNLAWDLGQMSILFKPFKAVAEPVKKSSARKWLNLGLQAGQEGIEESTQFVIGEEAKRSTYEDDVDFFGKNFNQRFSQDYWNDGEMWTSAFFGALGGIVMQGGGSAINNFSEKQHAKSVARRDEAFKKAFEKKSEEMVQAATDLASGNKFQAKTASYDALTQLAFKHMSDKGSMENVVEMYEEQINSADPNDVKEAIENGALSVEEVKEFSEFAEKTWNNVNSKSLKYGDAQKGIIFGMKMTKKRSEMTLAALNADRAALATEAQNNPVSDITPEQFETNGLIKQKEFIEEQLIKDHTPAIKNALKKQLKSINRKIKDKTFLEDVSNIAQEQIEKQHVLNMVAAEIANDNMLKAHKNPKYAEDLIDGEIEQRNKKQYGEAKKEIEGATTIEEFNAARDQLDRTAADDSQNKAYKKSVVAKQGKEAATLKLDSKSKREEVIEQVNERYFNNPKMALFFTEATDKYGVETAEQFADRFESDKDFKKYVLETLQPKTNEDADPNNDNGDEHNNEDPTPNINNQLYPLMLLTHQYEIVDGKVVMVNGQMKRKDQQYMTDAEFEALNSGQVKAGDELSFVIVENDEWNKSGDATRNNFRLLVRSKHGTVGILRSSDNNTPELQAIRKAVYAEYKTWQKNGGTGDFVSSIKTSVKQIHNGKIHNTNQFNNVGDVFETDEVLSLAIAIEGENGPELLAGKNHSLEDVTRLANSKSGAVYIVFRRPDGSKAAYATTTQPIGSVPAYQAEITKILKSNIKRTELQRFLRPFISYADFGTDLVKFLNANENLKGQELADAFFADPTINANGRLAQVHLTSMNNAQFKVNGMSYKEFVMNSGAIKVRLPKGTKYHSAGVSITMPDNLKPLANKIEDNRIPLDYEYSGSEETRKKIDEVITGSNDLINPGSPEGDGEHYISRSTGTKHKRVSNVIDPKAKKGKISMSVHDAWYAGSAIDELVRDFFNGDLDAILDNDQALNDKYGFIFNSNRNTKYGKLKPFLNQLVKLRNEFNKRGETVFAQGIKVNGEFEIANGVEYVAGEIDLLTVDKDGKFRIYDMKTMKNNDFVQGYWRNGYKGAMSKHEKYTRQMSMYAMMLYNTYGINVEKIEVLPIHIEHGERTSSKEWNNYKEKNDDVTEDKGTTLNSVVLMDTNKIKLNDIVLTIRDKVEQFKRNKPAPAPSVPQNKTTFQPENNVDYKTSAGDDQFQVIRTEEGFYLAKNINGDWNIVSRLTKSQYFTYLGNRKPEFDLEHSMTMGDKIHKFNEIHYGSDAKFKRKTGEAVYNIEEKEIEWFKKTFPGLPLHMLEDLNNITANGGDAWGMFKNAAVYLVKNGQRGTAYHEAFHALFHLFLTPTQQQQLLDEATQKWGELSALDLEEKMADAFMDEMVAMEYEMEGDQSLGSKIKDFFKRLYYMLKSLVTDNVSMDEVFFRLRKGMIGNRVDNGMSRDVTRFKAEESGDVDFTQRYTPDEQEKILRLLTTMFMRAVRQRVGEGKISPYDIKAALDIDTQLPEGMEFMGNLFFSATNPSSVYATIASIPQYNNDDAFELLTFMTPYKNEQGEWVKPQLYDMFIEKLAMFGFDIKFEENAESVQEREDVNHQEESTSENHWAEDNIRVDQYKRASVGIKAFLADITRTIYKSSKKDKVSVEGFPGFDDSMNPYEIYSEVAAIIHDSKNSEDMMDKLRKAASHKPWLKKEEGDKGIFLIDKLEANPDMITKLYNETGVLTANQPMMGVNDGHKFMTSNTNNMFNRIYRLWEQSLGQRPWVDGDNVNKDVAGAFAIADMSNEEMLLELGINLDEQAARAIGEDEKINKLLSGIFEEMSATGKNPLKGERPSKKATALIRKMEGVVNFHINPTFFTIDGKRAYLYNNPNFISREIEKYKSGSKTSNQPIAGRLKGAAAQYGYLTGTKFKGEGVKYQDMNKKQLYRTMMMAWYNGGKETGWFMLPILADAPHMGLVRMNKYKRKDSQGFLRDHHTPIFGELYNDIVAAAIIERNEKDKFEYFEGREGFFDFIPDDLLFAEDKGQELHQLIGTEMHNGFLEFQKELKALNVPYKDIFKDDNGLRDYYFNHWFSQAQFVSLFEGDFRHFSGVSNFIKRHKQIYSPGKFVDTKATWNGEKVRENFYAHFVPEGGDDFFDAAKQESESWFTDIIKNLGIKIGAYKKNDTTDAQAWIDPMRYREQDIMMGQWTQKKENAYKRITGGYLYTTKEEMAKDYANLGLRKPFLYDLVRNYDGNERPLQIKLSETTMIPHIDMHHEKKAEMLKKMGWSMDTDGRIYLDPDYKDEQGNPRIDMWVSESAVKVGFEAGMNKIPADSWRLQGETPPHIEGTEIFNRQIRKLIYANSKDRATIKKYLDLIKADHIDNWNEVKAKMKDETFRKKLKDMSEESGLDKDFKWAIDNLILSHPIIAGKVIPMIISTVNKGVKKKKMKGSALYNASDANNDRPLQIKFNKSKTKIEYFEAIVPVYDKRLNWLWEYTDDQGYLPKEGEPKYEEMMAKLDPKILEGLFYRIPTEEQYSMTTIKIVGLTPLSQIILPKEITTISGLDFDIDKMNGLWREFEEVDGKFVPTDVRNNEILDLVHKMLGDPNTLKSQLDPGAFGDIESFADDKGRDSKFTDIKHPSFTGYMHDVIQSARKLVGQFANANSMTPLYQQVDYMEFTSEFEIVKNNKKVYRKKFGGDIRKDTNGKLISKNLAEFLGAALDDRNNPILGAINVNSHTQPLIVAMLSVGYSVRDVLRFINAPAFVHMVDLYKVEEGNKTLATFIADQLQIRANKSDTGLATDEEGNLIIKPYPIDISTDRFDEKKPTQMTEGEGMMYLTSMVHYLKMAKSMATLTTHFKVGDSELGLLSDVMQQIDSRTDSVIGVKGDLDYVAGAIDFLNDTDLIVDNELYFRGTVDAINTIIDITDSPVGTLSYKNIQNHLKPYFKWEVNPLSLKHFNAYLASSLPLLRGHELHEASKNTAELIKDYADQKLTDHKRYFIDKFYVKKDGSITTSMYIDPAERAQIRHIWWDLLNNGNAQEKELATALVYYAIQQGNMGFDPKGFFDLIPIRFFDPARFDFTGLKDLAEIKDFSRSFEFAFLSKNPQLVEMMRGQFIVPRKKMSVVNGRAYLSKQAFIRKDAPDGTVPSIMVDGEMPYYVYLEAEKKFAMRVEGDKKGAFYSTIPNAPEGFYDIRGEGLYLPNNGVKPTMSHDSDTKVVVTSTEEQVDTSMLDAAPDAAALLAEMGLKDAVAETFTKEQIDMMKGEQMRIGYDGDLENLNQTDCK